MPPKVLVWPYVVVPWPCPLTFRTQNLSSSSLSLIASHALTDSRKTACLRHGSNGDGGTKWPTASSAVQRGLTSHFTQSTTSSFQQDFLSQSLPPSWSGKAAHTHGRYWRFSAARTRIPVALGVRRRKPAPSCFNQHQDQRVTASILTRVRLPSAIGCRVLSALRHFVGCQCEFHVR